MYAKDVAEVWLMLGIIALLVEELALQNITIDAFNTHS